MNAATASAHALPRDEVCRRVRAERDALMAYLCELQDWRRKVFSCELAPDAAHERRLRELGKQLLDQFNGTLKSPVLGLLDQQELGAWHEAARATRLQLRDWLDAAPSVGPGARIARSLSDAQVAGIKRALADERPQP